MVNIMKNSNTLKTLEIMILPNVLIHKKYVSKLINKNICSTTPYSLTQL